MVTPYTTYGTNTVHGTVATCNTLVTSTGAGAVTKTTLIGTATGYGEIWSQGNAGAWPAAGSLGGVGPHGWLSGTELEGNTLVGGNFTPSYTLNVSAGSITADLYERIYIRTSGGVFTQIGTNMVKSGVTITTIFTVYTWPATSIPLQGFGVGDKLYRQLDMHILTNSTGSGAATLGVLEGSSTSLGRANDVQLITQGYTAGGGGGGGGVVGGFALATTGSGVSNAHYDTFRVVAHPDASLSLGNMGRIGSSFFGYNATLPSAATTLGLDLSTDGFTFTDMTLQNGGSIPGINAQLDPVVDLFNVNTSANYTSTVGFGGSVATWTYDTANSRITANNGARGVYLYSAQSAANVDLLCDMDESDAGGLCWCYSDSADYYSLAVCDTAAVVGTKNTLTLYKTVAGVQSQISQVAISFLRGTFHRVRALKLDSAITITFDGATAISFTDSTPLPAGQAGLINNAGIAARYANRAISAVLDLGLAGISSTVARFYQFWCQQQGDYVGGTPQGDTVSGTFVYSLQRLATTDSTVSPQVLDMTVAAYPPNIGAGIVIPTADYRYTFIDKNLVDLAKQSNYEWTIDETKTLNFNKRQVKPAPWILQSSTIAPISDLEVDTQLIVEVANDQYRNRQVLIGVLATIPFTMTITGNGQASSFPLPYPLCPTCPQPVFTLNGRPLAGAQKGHTGADWYYDVQLKGDPSIAQDSNGTVLTNTDVMTVSGTGVYITNLVIDNLASQAALAAIEGGTGIVEAVEDVTARAMDVPTATTYGNQLLARFGVIGRTFTFTTYRNGLDVGQLLPIFLPEMGVWNGQFLLSEVDISLQTQPNNTVLYKYLCTASEIAYAGSWQKLFASGLLQ